MEPNDSADAPDTLKGAGRFAPTPTGQLHIGNARTAFLAWISARSSGLRNVLRVEDLDPASMPNGCLLGQYEDLDWLGLSYDEEPRSAGPVGPYRQSERYDRYAVALNQLNELGLLYPCWCSRKEVRLASRAPHASDEGPVYPGTCRPTVVAPLDSLCELPVRRDRKPALRLNVKAALQRLDQTSINFSDHIAGPQSFDMESSMGDFVVRRVDGIAAYQIACAIDDAEMNCTQVLRGIDLLPSTARQLLILETLGLMVPSYAHVGLVIDAEGERLAKRSGGLALASLRAHGYQAPDVIRALARLSGLPDTSHLEILTQAFELSNLKADPVRLMPDWI